MKYTDTQLLDFLQAKLGTYTGKVICRWSDTGRGWRLHETEHKGAGKDVRKAITKFVDKFVDYDKKEN